MKTMKIDNSPSYYITVSVDDNESGIVQTDLMYKNAKSPDAKIWNAAVDGMLSLILAQACQGVDIEADEYKEAVETVLDSLSNTYGE